MKKYTTQNHYFANSNMQDTVGSHLPCDIHGCITVTTVIIPIHICSLIFIFITNNLFIYIIYWVTFKCTATSTNTAIFRVVRDSGSCTNAVRAEQSIKNNIK